LRRASLRPSRPRMPRQQFRGPDKYQHLMPAAARSGFVN
jgi:hypothetical protein